MMMRWDCASTMPVSMWSAASSTGSMMALNVVLAYLTMCSIILYRMMHFRVVITVRVDCSLVIWWCLMMSWVLMLSLMGKMMMHNAWVDMIASQFSRSRSISSEPIWNFLNREVLLRLPDSWIWRNMGVRYLSLVAYLGSYAWMTAIHGIWWRTLLFESEKSSRVWRGRSAIFLYNLNLMCRYNHFLSWSKDLLLLKSPWRYFSYLACAMRSLISWWWGRYRWILLRCLSWNKGNIFKLYTLHHSAPVRFPYRHASPRCHGMMLRIRVCLYRGSGLRRVRGVHWGPKLYHLLCNNLPWVIITERRLIIAR